MLVSFIEADTITVATETSVPLPCDCNMKLNGGISCGRVFPVLLKLVIIPPYVHTSIGDPVTSHVIVWTTP